MGMPPARRDAIVGFWSYLSFMLNSIVFLLLGLQVHVRTLANAWLAVLLSYIAVSVGRAVMIFGVSALLKPTRERLDAGWPSLLVLGGLRGALSMVLALSLPPSFPNRDRIVTTTFGIVILSILLQGSVITMVTRRMAGVAPEGAADDSRAVAEVTSKTVGRTKSGSLRANRHLSALPESKRHLRAGEP
ncbi:MAG: cation:proton antiporter [Gemmatimonadota bacterium]|nr:cation:proton antiporter [Gemmatimonadota bacterium]